MGRMFGTDGVRGVANQELTPLIAYYLGRAYAAYLIRQGQPNPRVMVGRDTRISGPMLEGALTAGVASTGVDVCLAGVVPTPGVAYLVRQAQAAGGVVISASHNPVEDNGIKLFGPDGFKLNDETEDAIEASVRRLMGGDDDLPRPVAGGIGRVMPYEDAAQLYTEYLASTVNLDLSNLRIIVDCAHGAAVPIAGPLLRWLGATVVELNVEPDGLNINVKCGSTHPAGLAEAVVRHKGDIGFAYDGDTDRVIAVDEHGQLVDGDRILAICARHMLDRNLLPNRAIAVTNYSNLGLIDAIEAVGGRVVTTQAGDRYVLEAMREHGLTLGGEQSGHIIFLDHNTTGDGLLTSLQLLQVMYEREATLAQLRSDMEPYPQHLVSVRVMQKEGWDENERIVAVVKEAESRLSGAGRLLVRASGTESVIRVMGEARDAKLVQRTVERVAEVIEQELG